LDDIGTDLNYTGIVLDNWDHPVNLIPVAMVILYLIMGIPRSLLGLWVLINGCVIHPWMDGVIGVYGVGPKYLVDEYAVLDARYWVLQDGTVRMISLTEFYVMAPLCILWYYGMVNNKWYQHFYGIIVSILQLTGTIVYVGAEAWDGYKHMPADDSLLAPSFDSYLKLKYFWFVYVFMNNVWTLIPVYVCYQAYVSLGKAVDQQAGKKNK
jgi:cholestenol delta-isomerase